MAFDYKVVQAMETAEPPIADGYCPECGRPWRHPSPERSRDPAPFAWHRALLIVVGLALAITFGLPAMAAYQSETATQRDVAVLTLCLDGMKSDPGCPSVQDAEEWRAIDYDEATASRRQLEFTLVATILGLLALGLGAGSVVWQRRRAGTGGRGRSSAATAWRVGETALSLLCFGVLALYLDFVTLRLSPGVPLGETLDRASGDALAIISRIAGA